MYHPQKINQKQSAQCLHQPAMLLMSESVYIKCGHVTHKVINGCNSLMASSVHFSFSSSAECFMKCIGTVVFLEVSYIRETLSTSLARIWPYSCVDLHVGFHIIRLAESSPTHITAVWLFSSVNKCMSPKVAAVIKRPVTCCTFERFLTCMSALMTFKSLY